MGGGEPQWDGGGVGGRVQGGGVQGGGVQGRREPRGGGTYEGRPLSSTIHSQAPASSDQQVKWTTLFVAHLPYLGKWHAFPVGGGLVRPTTRGGDILIGDSAFSIDCTGDWAFSYNKSPPAYDKNDLIIGDYKNMGVEVFGCVDVAMHLC